MKRIHYSVNLRNKGKKTHLSFFHSLSFFFFFFWYYNLGQITCRLFHLWAQFLFTASETELDYYHQKMNVRFALRVNNLRLGKLGNFKKIPEMLGFDGEYPAVHPKAKFWSFLLKNCTKLAVKHSIEKPILFNFVNLPPSFCPRL